MNTSALNLFGSGYTAPKALRGSSLLVRSLGIAGAMGAALVLLGWSADLPALRSLGCGSPPVRPGIALCFLLSAASLLTRSMNPSECRRGTTRELSTLGTATAAVAIAALMLILDWSRLEIDSDAFDAAALGLAVTVVGVGRFSTRMYWTIAVAAAFTAAGLLCAQLLGVPLGPLNSPATTVLCALLTVAACLARTSDGLGRLLQSGALSGVVARAMFPPTVVLPMLVAWSCARLLGVRDTGAAIGLTELTMGITVGLCAAVWVAAQRIDRDHGPSSQIAPAAGRVPERGDGPEESERRSALDLLTSRFNLATRAAGIGVFEHDAGSGELWWSEMMFAIVGQPVDGFTPTLAAWRDLIHPEDRARVTRLGDAALLALDALDIRYRVVRPDGSVRHVQSISSYPHENPPNGARRVGVLLDVTERIEAELRERVLEVQLRESFHQTGLAQTANGVLQSVEQALSGVGLAASTMRRDLTELRPERVEQVAQLIAANRADIASFLAEDVRGKYLPDFLLAIAGQIKGSAQNLESELGQIETFILHLRDVIGAQQSLIPMGGTIEPTDLRDLVEVALLVQAPDFARTEVVRDYQELPLILTDRHKLLQIVVCFVSNARDAMLLGGIEAPRVVVRVLRDADDAVFTIEDSGPGMTDDTLAQLWEFGFTTKRNGQGFGLHASALAAREIGARVSAASDGPGRGARFTVRLPLGGAPRLN